MLMTGTAWVRVKGLCREVPNVNWIMLALRTVRMAEWLTLVPFSETAPEPVPS